MDTADFSPPKRGFGPANLHIRVNCYFIPVSLIS
jgi:hypothetical protein